jgi:hypothetical protein
MLRGRFISAFVLVALLATSWYGSAAAAGPKNKGLLISPLKTYTAVDAGGQKTDTFTVANFTDRPITVDLSVKQFSVSDYAYNFSFSEPSNKWIALKTQSVALKPNENRKIDYTVTVPPGSAPGGYYFTLFASAQLTSSGLASTVRAASLLYLTVNGQLIQTSAPIGSNMSHFSFKRDVPYYIDVKNTGNVHYFANFFSSMNGILLHTSPTGNSHLLLPGKARHVTGTARAPFLPGIYRAQYGYKTDAGDSYTASTYVIFIPLWSIAALLLALFAAYRVWVHRKKILATRV